MPVLKSLAFTTMPKTTIGPVQIRRAKFIAKLEEQKTDPSRPQLHPNGPTMGRC
jgi:hypothetical protein